MLKKQLFVVILILCPNLLIQNFQKPYDQYVEAASIMAMGHNVLIRGLNSIYLQAPHVNPEDVPDFASYALCWHEVLDAHHRMEEESMFPRIEKETGEKGIMDGNVEEHRIYSFLTIYNL